MGGSWVEADWSLYQDQPSGKQRELSLSGLRFRVVPVTAAPIQQTVAVFRSIYTNGGAYVAAFDVVESDETAAWFISRNRAEYSLAERLLRSPTFAQALPEVSGTTGPGRLEPIEFERSSSLVLDGELARMLQVGGAHSVAPMPGKEAKKLGAAFCHSCFGDRYDDVPVDHSWSRWSGWFKGLVDATWVLTDKRHKRITVLCITDVD